MKIKQYNFIRGKVASGKTTAISKLVSVLGRQTIYFNLEGSTLQKSRNIMSIVMQRPSYQSILHTLNGLDKSSDIVIDPISVLYSGYDSFIEFLQLLPHRNRYFFVDTQNTRDNWSESEAKNEINNYNLSLSIPSDLISVFEVRKIPSKTNSIEDDIYLFNLNDMVESNLRDLHQVMRDIKIRELLS